MLRFEELPEVNSERWLSLEDLEGEVWKGLRGCESKYRISNYGRLKSLVREYPHLGGIRRTKEKIIKPQLDKTTGYYKAVTYTKGVPVLIHRMVSTTFIPNPNGYPFVNHKDENRKNNTLENLEWCTPKYNLEYSHVSEKNKDKLFKKVVQIDKDGNIVNKFKTTGEAARYLGLGSYSSIALCCKGGIGSVKGFIWRYEDSMEIVSKNPRHRRVIQKDMSGNEIRMFDSIKEASDITGCHTSCIIKTCKGEQSHAGGFLWEYKDKY